MKTKRVSIANYSYVHKIMKSLQNGKMSFDCKLFVCTQNNEIVTKWINEFQLQVKQVEMQYMFLSANGNLKKKIKQNWAKKTANFKNEQKKRVRKKFF